VADLTSGACDEDDGFSHHRIILGHSATQEH
jgi:hypothetical protein